MLLKSVKHFKNLNVARVVKCWSERCAYASAEVAIVLGVIFLFLLSSSSESLTFSTRKKAARLMKFCLGS